MPIRTADAVWEGSLQQGKGRMKTASGAVDGKFSFTTRMENDPGTNPEELLGAAHAGCYSMAFSAILGKAGFQPKRIATQARVHLDKAGEGFKITRIELRTDADIPNIDEPTFKQHAEKAKTGCVISQALGGVPIELQAKLTTAAAREPAGRGT